MVLAFKRVVKDVGGFTLEKQKNKCKPVEGFSNKIQKIFKVLTSPVVGWITSATVYNKEI